MASMVSLVAAGVGVTLVPESVCQLRPAGVRYVRINGQAPVAMLWLVAQRERHGMPLSTTFCDTPRRSSRRRAGRRPERGHTHEVSIHDVLYIGRLQTAVGILGLGAAHRHEQAIFAGSGSMRHLVSVC